MSINNVPSLVFRAARATPERTAIRDVDREYTYAEVAGRVRSVAAGLSRLGVRPEDRVGLRGRNSAAWLIADLGIQAAGAITVPVHADLPTAASEAQLAHCGARTAIDPDAPPAADPAPDDGATPGPNDIATIVYTSGTTGEPKGVVLTHGNLLANVCGAQEAVPLRPDDRLLSWLPFSHIYSRCSDAYRSFAAGCELAIAPDPDAVTERCHAVRPTVLRGVPRFFEKMLREPGPLPALFGGRIRILFVGGAPLPARVEAAYREAGLCLLQGYGLTETAPTATVNRPGSRRDGTVGRPLPGCEVRIADDGEVLIRGPIVTPGYWGDPAATASAIRDGWLHTGDLGDLDSNGFLSVTGRKSDRIVLSTGKKVDPAPIEAILRADREVEHAVLVGDGRPYLAALIVATAGANAPALADRLRAAVAHLAPWERVGRFAFLDRPFSVRDGESTVSGKLRRAEILRRNAGRIDSLYG